MFIKRSFRSFDYCSWLADLTNTTGGRALYALNMWSHEIKETEFKLEAEHVCINLLKTQLIFLQENNT